VAHDEIVPRGTILNGIGRLPVRKLAPWTAKGDLRDLKLFHVEQFEIRHWETGSRLGGLKSESRFGRDLSKIVPRGTILGVMGWCGGLESGFRIVPRGTISAVDRIPDSINESRVGAILLMVHKLSETLLMRLRTY
jgi:hypothetical protein